MDESPNTAIPDEELRKMYGGWIKRAALMLKYRMPWADLDELIQSGAVGMLEALKRFNPTYGVEFKVFASRRIRGAMIDGLRREGALRVRRGQLIGFPDVDPVQDPDLRLRGSAGQGGLAGTSPTLERPRVLEEELGAVVVLPQVDVDRPAA